MWSVLKKAVRDSRWTMFWLAFGFGLYAIIVVSFYPTILEQQEELNKMMEGYGDMMAFMGAGDAENFDIAEPGGFIHSQQMLWLLLITGSLLIYQAFNAITNAEREGTLDMVLSLPIARREYLVGRILSSVFTILAALTGTFLGFFAAARIWPEFDVEVGELAVGIYAAFLPLIVVAGFAYMLASFIPSSKRFAGAIAYLFLVGSYLFHGLSLINESTKGFSKIFLFDYYHTGNIFTQGVDLGQWAVLIAVALVYLVIAYWRIDHKELGV